MGMNNTLRIASLSVKQRWFNSGDMSREVTSYVDYLEKTVKNLHYQASLVARAAGGDVPDTEDWVPGKGELDQ